MIKRYSMIFALMGFVVSMPLFAQQSTSLTPAQKDWQTNMAPTLQYAQEQQQKAEQEAQQQQQQRIAQQLLQHEMLQTLRAQRREHQMLHAPVSTEPLFHPKPLPPTGGKNPWLKSNPWANTQKNPYQGKQYSPTPQKPGGVATPQQTQQSSPIFIQSPTQQQPASSTQQQKQGPQQPVNIFR